MGGMGGPRGPMGMMGPMGCARAPRDCTPAPSCTTCRCLRLLFWAALPDFRQPVLPQADGAKDGADGGKDGRADDGGSHGRWGLHAAAA